MAATWPICLVFVCFDVLTWLQWCSRLACGLCAVWVLLFWLIVWIFLRAFGFVVERVSSRFGFALCG